MKQARAERLALEFAEAKMMHAGALYEQNDKAQIASNKYVELADKLIEMGEPGIAAFAELLTHKRTEVRAAAATFLLPYRTESATEVLREVGQGHDLTALAAKVALARWEGGESKVWEEIHRLSENIPLKDSRRRKIG